MTDLEVKQRLDVLKTTFAPGKYWNHDPAQTNDPSSVRDIPCQHHDSNLSTCDFYGGCGCNSFYNSIQCAGFALYMAYRVFGHYPSIRMSQGVSNGATDSNGWTYYTSGNFSGIDLSSGDIVYRKNEYNQTHYAIIHYIDSVGNVYFGEALGSEDCKIAWGFFNDGSQYKTVAQIKSIATCIMKAPKDSSGGGSGGGSSTAVEVSFKWNYIGAPSENAYVISYEPGLPYSQKGMPTPTREGYEFGGWCSDPEGTDIFPPSHQVPNYPHSLYAKWIPLATVYFKWNYVGAPAENAFIETYRPGLPYSQKGMPIPTREGYEFGGWCSDIEGTDIFTEDHIVPNWSHDLYAKWIQVATVFFKWNYTGAPAENAYIDTYRCGLPYSQKGMPIPTREGYEFGGWCSDKEGTDIFTEDHIVPNWSHDLYAKWIRCITVYYMRNRTSVDATCLKQKTCYPGQPFGEMEGYKEYETADAYYKFKGYYSARSGGTQYTADSIVPNISENSLKVYAQWTRVAAVTYIENSVSPDSYESTLKWPVGEAMAVLPAGCDGYRFDGWYTALVGGTRYRNGSIVPEVKNLTLYGHWTRIIKVTLKCNFSGFDTSTYSTFNAYDGEAYGEALPVSMDRSGYRFDGWFTERLGGSQVTSETLCSNSDHTLYAHWTKVTAVIFSDNYSGNSVTIYCPTNERYGSVLSQNIPVREGCTFKGWYKSADPDGARVFPQTLVPEDTVVLYAHWSVRVLFDPCGGCIIGDSVMYYDVGYMFCRMPEVCCCEEKKYFDGWYTLPNGKGEKVVITTTVPDYNMVLYANWRPEL